MGLIVQNDNSALNSCNMLNRSSKSQQNSLKKLISGAKINSASDDASGLAVSEKMRNQITALNTVTDNCEDGVNLLQTADGNIAEIQDIISRMVELAGKASNEILDDDDRNALQDEMFELCAEVDRIASTANFNGTKLLTGDIEQRELEYTRIKKFSDVSIRIDNKDCIEGKDAAQTVNEIVNAVISQHPQIKENIGKITDYDQVLEIYLNDVKDGSSEVTPLPIDPSEECAPLPKLKAYYNKIAPVEMTIAEAPPYDPFSGVTVSIGYTYSSNKDEIIRDDRYVIDGINLKVGDSSVQADQVDFPRPNLYSDNIFKTRTEAGTVTVTRTVSGGSGTHGGAGGFGGASNIDTEGGGSTTITSKVQQYSDDYIPNPVSTYKNAVAYDIRTADKATNVLARAREISDAVSEYRSYIGALQNKLEYTINSTAAASENITASKSRIMDTDMAEEITEYTKNNIISQSSQSMLAQANVHMQDVLSLLKQE